ncbi:class I SAM-dependent methyltransferase [Ensifer adhaerens]|uniref:class I SAM-dependent methyltransferase n=1 Tax=Ensifer adhaerens TaxID=106592 RepID=UPI000FD9BE33|nr:class I SAM-dependent methyltransferase [Ensifer adhaerens]MDF8358655.1 methyltransferase domain-containing protein [Ensifer adhaerens]THA59478.1 class I SAM-dependent methyltransferase [Ensifer adhaerens]
MLENLFKPKVRSVPIKSTAESEDMEKCTEFLSYAGFDIPHHLINLTGSGADTFIVNAEGQLAELRDKIGIEPHYSVVEVGCGVGRSAIPLASVLTHGTYLGIDIIEESIVWDLANIAEKYPNFQFVHFDVKDDLHNPAGRMSTMDITIPVEDCSVDRVIFWSVFTHLFEVEISHYLRECRRVLKPNGRVWASCFVITPEVLAAARSTDLTQWALSFPNEPDASGCYINNLDVPRGAVGYAPEALTRIVSGAGLTMTRDFVKGMWSGYYNEPESGQDGIIMRKAK